VFSFSFDSRNFKISSLISSVAQWSFKSVLLSQVWWHITALRNLRQEGHEFEASLGCIVSSGTAYAIYQVLISIKEKELVE
jgi:hypothetical protein